MKYQVRGYRTFGDYERHNGCDIDYDCDTLAEAKQRAKYVLSDDYQRDCEASAPCGYSQVVRLSDGVVMYDCFRALDARI